MTHPTLETFLKACGSDEPLRVGVGPKDEKPSESWTFQQPFLVIGRSPDSDLMLDHWQVSRRHAYIQLINGRYYCLDLASRTGTHGGDASKRSGWLERGRPIQIGPFAVLPEWPIARSFETTTGVTWELPNRAVGQALWRMDRPLVLIGRSPACKIRIVEPDVSKFHCSLVLTSQGVWVVDLLGQKGVFLNDEPVRCARLEDGDQLRIGRHVFRPRYDSSLPPLPRPTHPADNHEPGPLATLVQPSPFSIGGGGISSSIMPGSPPTWPPPGQEISSVRGLGGGAIDPSINILVHQFGMMQQQMLDQFHQTMMMMFEGFAAINREQSATLREEFEQVRQLSREIEELKAETARLANAVKTPDRLRPPPLATNGRPPVANHTPTPSEPIKKATPPPPPADPDVDIHTQLCLRLATIQGERQNRWQKILGMMSSRP